MKRSREGAKFCIIGAGPSGLTIAKNFKQVGISFDWFEKEGDIGGVWNYKTPHGAVYDSTHLISSKKLTEYTDFPMPEEYPDYPAHRQVIEYLRSYVSAFCLSESLRLETTVESARPISRQNKCVLQVEETELSQSPLWEVRTTHKGITQTDHYQGLVIANGHHWDCLWPEGLGDFSGEVIHSHDYKSAEQLKGKRVLVIGAGNSGCDISVEAAQNGVKAYQSMRRGYHFLPKFILGKPADHCGDRLMRWRMPLWLRRKIAAIFIRVTLGDPQRFGLPRPDHRLFETHPIINSQLYYYVGHGDLEVKPAIKSYQGKKVIFVDGTEAEVDLIVCATGYRIRFPFIETDLLNWKEGRPDLFLNTFHPKYKNLFVGGLTQPNSGQWGLTDLQAQLMAGYVLAQKEDHKLADWFSKKVAGQGHDLSGGISFKDSARHLLEVEYFSYRKLLLRYGKKFEAIREKNNKYEGLSAESVHSPV
ncbi:MAG: NAD(P)-binding domain-containing protein [Pirellulaceae bacterium]|nr:NAD(P)-binding domain-containing protein [Pirellulaceae bacterium]